MHPIDVVQDIYRLGEISGVKLVSKIHASIPLGVRHKSKQVTKNWCEKLSGKSSISLGGAVILITSVLHSLSTYIFPIHVSMKKNLDRIRRNIL